jgi:hypothetical protein
LNSKLRRAGRDQNMQFKQLTFSSQTSTLNIFEKK